MGKIRADDISSRSYDIRMHEAELQSDGSYVHGDGEIYWYNELGDIHREDGPAVIALDGSVDWFLNDKRYSFDEWLIKLNKSDEDKMMLRLQYA